MRRPPSRDQGQRQSPRDSQRGRRSQINLAVLDRIRLRAAWRVIPHEARSAVALSVWDAPTRKCPCGSRVAMNLTAPSQNAQVPSKSTTAPCSTRRLRGRVSRDRGLKASPFHQQAELASLNWCHRQKSVLNGVRTSAGAATLAPRRTENNTSGAWIQSGATAPSTLSHGAQGRELPVRAGPGGMRG